ncbi:MAG: aldo/keto reductase, partial [Clostridia bacterium]
MEKILLGSKLPSAPIALGCMRMAGVKDERDAEAIVKLALEEGIDLFDHADIYGGGESERIFGRILKKNPGMRDQMLVQGKCGICKGYYDASKEHIMEATEGILARLGVDYLDTLLLHRPDALLQPEEVAEAFLTLRAQGKVRYFGVSNQNAAQLALLERYLPNELILNQLQFSMAHTGMVDEGVNVNMHTEHAVMRDGSVLDYCRLHEITIQAWSPFQYGMFEGVFLGCEKFPELNRVIDELAEAKGVTNSAIAVAWIMRHPAKIQTIVGTMKAQRLRDICAA